MVVKIIVKGGYSTYGQTIGIISFQGIAPRIPGDIGHADTLDANVCYEILDDVSFMDLVNGSAHSKVALIQAAKRLEQKGVKAITGDCGLLSIYQEDIASQLRIPFFSSSLLLIPLIWSLQGMTGRIGIVTGHSAYLNEQHLAGAGIVADIPLAIFGMENESEFQKVVISGSSVLDTEKMKSEALRVCGEMLEKSPDIKSIVLECSNLPSYAHQISLQIGLPVYDITGLAKMMINAVAPPLYL